MVDLSNFAVLAVAQGAELASRSELRWEFASMAAAVALFSVALGSFALFFFRRGAREWTLIYFGVFCTLYAARLLTLQPSFRAIFDESRGFWNSFDWAITCTIIIPFGLFLYQIVSENLKPLVRWLLIAQSIFAVSGIVAEAMGVSLDKLSIANSVMVLGTLVAADIFLVSLRWRGGVRKRWPLEIKVFIAGFAIWVGTVVHANLLGLQVWRGPNVEFLGFLIFVASLGYIVVRRIIANEETLMAINKELEIARRIQFSTLPQRVPVLAGLEIAARYAPMSAVAGDFYDFLCVDEKRVGVLVADVTGHGVPAALIASMLKVAFAGQAAHADDPARVLSGLNRALWGKFDEHFVTAAYLFVDMEKGAMRYAAAGHPPLMLLPGAAGQVREIEENGLLLGMFPEADYTSVEFNVGPGDRCLLYTDGVLEAKNAEQEEFGKPRCREFVEKHRDVSPGKFASALLEKIAGFSGHQSAGAQEDDITLVVLDVQASTA
jgi:serine phosphatase RsbU (regulator of sigma subunit)